MKLDEKTTNQPSRRQQRSLPRVRNFFEARQTHQRRRIGSVIALLLACIGATAVMLN